MGVPVSATRALLFAAADEARVTLINRGSTLYYAGARDVSSTSNEGNLADGGSLTIAKPTWVISALSSLVEELPYEHLSIDTLTLRGGGSTSSSSTTINPKDSPYSATGLGVANDAPAINSAIAAASALGGGTVLIPAGTYLCNTGLVMKTGVNVVGASRNGTILKRGVDGIDLIQFYGTATGTATHIKYAGLHNLTVDGSSLTGRAINCVYADNIVLKELYVKLNNGAGIDMAELWDSRFDDVVMEDVNSTSDPALWIRSSQAVAGFGFVGGGETSNVIRINNCRFETWKKGGIVIETGLGGAAGAPVHFWFNNQKLESSKVRGPAILVTSGNNVHFDKVFVHMGAFDAAFATPQNAVQVDGGGHAQSFRNFQISNSAVATIAAGFTIWNTGATIDEIRGQYTTAPTTGNHMEINGGDSYRISGRVHQTGATRAVSIAAGVTKILDAGSRSVYAAQKPPVSTTDGTDTTPVAGTIYYGILTSNGWSRLTGLSYLVGSVGATGNVIVGLYNEDGTLLASSSLAGTAVGTAATMQRVPFTAALGVGPGRYFAAVQFSTINPRFRTHLFGDHPTGSQAGVVGTMAAITAPTTFTANVAPYSVTY